MSIYDKMFGYLDADKRPARLIWWVGLLSDPETEVTAPGYRRQPFTPETNARFDGADLGNGITVWGLGIFDAEMGGQLVGHARLSVPVDLPADAIFVAPPISLE